MTPATSSFYRARFGARWITARCTDGAWFDKRDNPLPAPDEWEPLHGQTVAAETGEV